MKFVQFWSSSAIIFIIGFVIITGFLEKKNVFELFTQGVIEGEKIILKLFPTWLALFVSIGMLKASGIISFLTDKIYIFLKNFFTFKDIIPLILLRPISGSTATAMGIDIMKNCGVDTDVGLLTSCIMGSTETTLYVVALYTAGLGGKNVKPVIVIGLVADFLCVMFSVVALRLGIM